jgi:hypothetical protein
MKNVKLVGYFARGKLILALMRTVKSGKTFSSRTLLHAHMFLIKNTPMVKWTNIYRYEVDEWLSSG